MAFFGQARLWLGLGLALFGAVSASVSVFAQVSRVAEVKSSRSFVYHGKLVRPDGSTPTGSMSVTLKILSPDPKLCVLWAETQTVDMKEGGFSIELGHGVHRLPGASGGAAADFKQTFVNNASLTISGAQCASGNSYTPTSSDDRLMNATFNDAGSVIEIAGLPIKSVPFALQAEEVAGFGIANLAKISGAGSAVTYTPAEVATLKDLLGGDVFFDMKSRAVKNVAAPVDGGDAANKSWVLSQISSSGGGTVSSVGFTAPSIFNVGGSPVTSSGNLSITLANQSANTVFAGPTTGGATAPTFRTLVAGDVPALDAGKITSGVLGDGRIPALDASKITTGVLGDSQIPSLDASKVSTGTFTASQIPALDASKISSGTLGAARIPALDASKITTGVLGADRGGTGIAPSMADANKVLGLASAGTATEYKSIVGVGTVSVSHSAGAITITGAPGADHLGNHTATQNLDLASYKLVGQGGASGLSITSSGSVGIGTTSPAEKLEVSGNIQLGAGADRQLVLPTSTVANTGSLTVKAANAGASTWVAGSLNLQGGSQTNTGGTSGHAGAVNISGGGAVGSFANGGNVVLTAGSSTGGTGQGLGGGVTITGGSGASNAGRDGGSIRLVAGNVTYAGSAGGDVAITAGNNNTNTAGAGALTLTAGNTNQTSIKGGAISLQPGNGTGGGGYGSVNLAASGGSVGIGTTSPSEKLEVVGGKIKSPEFCIGASCITAWPAVGGGGTVTDVTVAGGALSIANGNTTPQISLPVATTTVSGYLSSTDWNTFNNKQPAGAYLTSISSSNVTTALGYTPLSPTLATNQVLMGNGSSVATAGYFGLGQLRNPSGLTQFPSSCSDSQTMVWSSIIDQLVCSSINNLNADKITAGTIAPARLGSGTPDNTKFLRGDGTWSTPSAIAGTSISFHVERRLAGGYYTFLANTDYNPDYAVVDTNSGWSLANNWYVIPETGTYIVGWHFWTNTPSSTSRVYLYVDRGSGFALEKVTGDQAPAHSNSHVLNLSAGNKVKLHIYGGPLASYAGGAHNSFWGAKISNVGGGGSGTPGGSTTQLQFNDGGSFAGATGFVWDKTNSHVGIGTTSPTEKLEVIGKVKATELCIGTDCKSAWPAGGGGGTGMGSWQNVTASRALNATYTNSNTTTLVALISFAAPSSGNSVMNCQVNGVTIATSSITAPSGSNGYGSQQTILVPAGATYGCLSGGAAGASLMTWFEAVNWGGGSAVSAATGARNLIINGGFLVNQRGYATGTAKTVGQYMHDRWKAGASGATYTYTQSGGPLTTVTITAGSIQQIVEGINVVGGTYTLSWTGTAQARVNGGSYAASPLTTTGLAMGSNITVEFNTGTVGMVQLEAGASATAFELRDATTELQKCQRYYAKDGNHSLYVMGPVSGQLFNSVSYPVEMRVIPTVTIYAFHTNAEGYIRNDSNTLNCAAAIIYSSARAHQTYCNGATGGHNYRGAWAADAEL